MEARKGNSQRMKGKGVKNRGGGNGGRVRIAANEYYPPLIPKEHFLSHMRAQIDRFGPIARSLSTQAFEQKHQSTKQYLKRSGNRINVLKSVSTELERQTAFHARHEGLVSKPAHFTPEKAADDSVEGTGIKDIDGRDLHRCKSITVNSIVYRKDQFFELSRDYYVKVLYTLRNDNDDLFFFGRSYEGSVDPLTGVTFATPMEPEHLVLCHVQPFHTRIYNRERDFFDTDRQHRPLLCYSFKAPYEDATTGAGRVALFF